MEEIIKKYSDWWDKKTYNKNEILHNAGSIANNLFYIESGIIKVFIANEKNNKENTIAFFYDNEVIVPYKSFYENTPSITGIQTLTKSILYSIDKENWIKIKKQEPELNEFLLQETINILYKIIYAQSDKSYYGKSECYNLLLERQPYLKNISDEEIGLFIGSDRSYINKIKNKD